MKINVHFLAEWHVEQFLEAYDELVESSGLTEYAFGYALAKAYIDVTPANVAFLQFILENRSLFVEVEEAENACDVQP